jgi:hypothetical protein
MEALMRSFRLVFLVSFALLSACGGGDGSEADRVGVGAECSPSNPCPTYEVDGDSAPLACLAQFTGGYCGLEACASSLECPAGSICVHHTDGESYCFRACADKSECNRNRGPDVESNCSANFDWEVPTEDDGSKACIPPSSGS